MYDASRYRQVPPPPVSWTQSQLYEPTTLQSSVAPIGTAPGVSWPPYYNYPPYTPVPVNQYLPPAQVIPSQIIGKHAKAISPGTREVADGLRLLAAQTELWKSPVRGDRPVMGTSLSEPHSVKDGRSASPHHEYIEMATDDDGSSGIAHIQGRRRFPRPWSTDPTTMRNIQNQAETGFVGTERRRTYSKWFKRKRCRDTFCQTEDTLDIMTIDVVWLTQFSVKPTKPAVTSNIIKVYAAYSCVIEPYVGRAIPLDLNFQFPQAVYSQFTPCRGSKQSLQCDVFETVVPSLLRANAMVYVFNYTNHHCLVRHEDKIAKMTILRNYYPVLNIVERGEARPFG